VQRSFLPGSIDYDGAMSRDFNCGRALSSDSLAVWHAAFEPYLGRAANVLDLGSGTGRFSTLIADWFDAVVIGVEPARGMRKMAASSGRHPNVFYIAGRGEQIPLGEKSLAAALLSNVYHHITDKPACASELRRVLKPGGRVLIRGAFAGRLGEFTMFDHFPEARAICEQFPTMGETIQTFANSGFSFETVERVIQQTCSSLKQLAARTRLRADTTLAMMTDNEFMSRQAALERAAANETKPTPVIDTLDLLVLRKIEGWVR
jgi:ubiquinone/menaquinone biosynthesis C-methylase UbiE